MSIKAMNAVWSHPHLRRPIDKLVMLALADWANDEGVAYPSMAKLAAKSGITEQGARNVIHELEKAGFLTIHAGHGRGNVNTYQLHPSKGREVGREVKPQQENPFVVGVLEEENPNNKTLLSTVKPQQQNPFAAGAYNENHQVLTEPSGFEEDVLLPVGDNFPMPPVIEKALTTVRAIGLVLKDKERHEWNQIGPLLLADCGGDFDRAASEIVKQFGPDVWALPRPPHLSQIGTEWKRHQPKTTAMADNSATARMMADDDEKLRVALERAAKLKGEQ